jgi:hypothetical protein
MVLHLVTAVDRVNRKRPASLLVVAILSMVIGLHWTCCGMFNLGAYFPWIPDDLMGVQRTRSYAEDQTLLGQPVLKIVNWLRYLLDLLISLSLLVLAIGLLRLRPWARPLLSVCAALIILDCVIAFPLAYWQWGMDMQEVNDASDADISLIARYAVPIYVCEFFMIALLLAFGIGLLVVQRRAEFREAFRRLDYSVPHRQPASRAERHND